MKKILFFSLIALLTLAPHAFAEGFVALAPIKGLTDAGTIGSVINSDTLANFFNNLYKYCIGLGATIAVIQITWAGIDIAVFHKDAVSAITDDKGKIKNAIFGLILILSPVLVFSIINPSILNLSLNLPEIKLPTQASNTVSLPGGGTQYTDGNGTGAANGTWCFGIKVSSVPGNTDTRFQCWVDQKACSDYLNTIKSGADAWQVSAGAVCVQQVR